MENDASITRTRGVIREEGLCFLFYFEYIFTVGGIVVGPGEPN